METKYFPMSETIGFEVKSAKDIFAAKELGMIIRNEDDCDFDDMVTYTNEDGEEEEREPTENEMTNRAIEHLNNGGKVYATIYPSNYMLVDKRSTTLQTDFFVGQEVFYMKNNKICKKEIRRILLTKNPSNNGSCDDNTTISVKGGSEVSVFHYGGRGFVELAKSRTFRDIRENGNIGYAYDDFEIYDISEVFTTKEELVKHLMGED